MRRRLITALVASLPQGRAVQHNDKPLMTAKAKTLKRIAKYWPPWHLDEPTQCVNTAPAPTSATDGGGCNG